MRLELQRRCSGEAVRRVGAAALDAACRDSAFGATAKLMCSSSGLLELCTSGLRGSDHLWELLVEEGLLIPSLWLDPDRNNCVVPAWSAPCDFSGRAALPHLLSQAGGSCPHFAVSLLPFTLDLAGLCLVMCGWLPHGFFLVFQDPLS